MNRISILLSTYNGEKYLKEQLESILSQSFNDFKVLVRDDGSTDNTVTILKKYQKIYPNKIDILADNGENLRSSRSFMKLLENNVSDYVMFADQDDVWNADKIEKTYQKMQEIENMYGKNTPLLIHSNLTVTDQKLDILAPSFWKFQNINPNKQKLSDFLVDNNVTGCTMMINRALAEKVQTIPQEAIMHDWWIAMVASVFGKIAYIDEPLMLYRQHGKNDTGAKKYGVQYFIRKFFTKPSFEKYIEQSKIYLALYGHELDEYNKLMLQEFSQFDELNKLQKLKVLFKYKIWKNGFIRNLGLIFFV